MAALSNVCVLVGSFDLFRQIVGNQRLHPILTAILNRLFVVSAFEPQHIQRTVHVRATESSAPKSAWIASALLSSCSGAESPEMFTLNRCASGSFAVMLQNGSVMMPGSSRPRRAPATVRGYYCARARSARIVRDSRARPRPAETRRRVPTARAASRNAGIGGHLRCGFRTPHCSRGCNDWREGGRWEETHFRGEETSR